MTERRLKPSRSWHHEVTRKGYPTRPPLVQSGSERMEVDMKRKTTCGAPSADEVDSVPRDPNGCLAVMLWLAVMGILLVPGLCGVTWAWVSP